MAEETVILSHGRLITRFAALGPYLRQKKSNPDTYFFDCLSACVNAKKAPDEREFWGWWLELSAREGGFDYTYEFGKFDDKGDWVKGSVPAKSQQEVVATLESFYTKLTDFVEKELNLAVTPSSQLPHPKLGGKA
ncbi:sigma factor-binding protein Crl [Veronia nyctiphanis]|uniref:Sigma factor-binding protein Crl n=1 Tax=Veronia nyctiphanis TaxID=1278244 RepID=A0A4Q0YVD6_9GAMM|nr:sigma factor-binding protein Crl [Veronia nyctiphanis]RXJ73099.1 sigma factor-binding protein Crl [Veronia nyctiphanis]